MEDNSSDLSRMRAGPGSTTTSVFEFQVSEQALKAPVTPQKTYNRGKRKQQLYQQPQPMFNFDLNELPQAIDSDEVLLTEPEMPRRKKHRPRVAKDQKQSSTIRRESKQKKTEATTPTIPIPTTPATPVPAPSKRPRSRATTKTGTPATPTKAPATTNTTPPRRPRSGKLPTRPPTATIETPGRADAASESKQTQRMARATVEPALLSTSPGARGMAKKVAANKQQPETQILLDWIIDRLDRLCINEPVGQIVEFKGSEQQVVPFVEKKKLRPKVSLDKETTRVWNLLMAKGTKIDNEQYPDEETANRWATERFQMKQRVEAFISKMHLVQGDRRFSKWKGSVVDSIVGAFLTQNVSDHLSSSAFMAVASKFPVKKNGTSLEDDIRKPEDDSIMTRENRKVRRCLFGSDSTVEQQKSTPPTPPPAEVDVLTNSLVPPAVPADTEQGNCDQALQKAMASEGVNARTPKTKKQLKGIELAELEHRQGTAKRSYKWKDLRAKLCQDPEESMNFKASCGPPDSVNWKAVMLANVKELADAIKERGMNNLLAGRIKAFLEAVHEEQGNIDLEWVRQVSQEEAKEFLLTIRGLGLKSVECIRLLELEHCAFPVDTNVGRICVRLGWVPIEPLPEELQIHLLELYPIQTTIQKYLWPRLCKLDQRVLYELHYQMITFGKVFCTKTKPNCNACPMKLECRHFASAYASHRLALPASDPGCNTGSTSPPSTFRAAAVLFSNDKTTAPKECIPIIEEPSTPESSTLECSPDIEDCIPDIEDCCPGVASEEVVSIDLRQVEKQIMEFAKALAVIPPESAYIPVPKLKVASRLRTVHYVYELPDHHALLERLEQREPDDPCYYLLAIWGPGDGNKVLSDHDYTEPSSSDEEFVKGTLLIPCRTAMRGSFPLNGTYFQVNEVFADHASSWSPVDVPRSSLWNLRRRFVYFGTSVTSIFRGMSTEEIQACFWRGYVCVRGFDIETRAPRPLMTRFHVPPTPSKRVFKDD